ncbi:hypothetical protein [Exiguobacterium aurantiacum]|uniref:ABC-type cobalt transport system, permease component CbiQ and related transporters n=1 Tax=Exiguobacterium aurantiacum TaxID=33987 RepID=A0ABY5FSE6_9BACL|nr:hypothetical protein [Exiguobacterium aurantiacum]UTT44189.1 hypothetical protein NMQ00_06740 [Exiguobacterium aurantiacum]
MRFLSSNEADWERRHPVTLLFFLIAHLYILTYVNDSVWLLVGLFGLLLIERRFPLTMLGVLVAFVLISFAPIIFGWNVSLAGVTNQLIPLSTFLFGMIWVNRFMRLERLLPFLNRWPRSTRLLYGGWALVPSMERAVRLSIASHPRREWQEAIVVGIDSQRFEPVYVTNRMRRFERHDTVQCLVLLGFAAAASLGTPVVWLLYPYLTKGGVRDALVILDRRS